MTRLPIFLLAALIGAAPAAAAPADSHRAPAESLAGKPAAADARQDTLKEMWQRGLLSADMGQWSPDDMALLLRMRHSESLGALGLLRRKFMAVNEFVVKDRPPGSDKTRIRLTKAGFERYLLLKSQEALTYFEVKGVEAKWAYDLQDLQGRSLFDRGSGLLTEAGEDLYCRALLNLPVFWRARTGEVMGNRPPQQAGPSGGTTRPPPGDGGPKAAAAASLEEFFPLKPGEMRLYMVYDADRKSPAKRGLHMVTVWDEVAAQEGVGGFKALVVRRSEGELSKDAKGGWVYGPPQKAVSESVYLVSPAGVDHRFEYAAAKPEELLKLRRQMLDGAQKAAPADLVKLMDNWVLPWPPRPGTVRRQNNGAVAHRVSDSCDATFLKPEYRAAALCVETSGPGGWQVSSWYVRGIGLVMREAVNPGKNVKEYPLQVQELLEVRRR